MTQPSNLSSFIGPGGGSQSAQGNANSNQWGQGTGEALDGGMVSTDEASMNPLFYEQAANTATAQAANYYAQGQAASNVAAPTITNATGAQSRQQLQGVQNNYGTLEKGLASTINGGGPNAGAATETQGLNANIAAQMAGAHAGRGGYNLGSALGAAQQGQAQNAALASNAAQARGSQINAAQGGLGSALNAQGQMTMAQDNTQWNAAQAQAQLEQSQESQNQQQAIGLYNQSAGEQGTYLNAVNEYGQQAHAAQGLAVSQNAINNQQEDQMIGTAAQVGGAALTGLAMFA